MKKILFLDIDGVLNRCGGQGLETAMVEQLRRIVEACDPYIVITSEWRKTEHQMRRIRDMLSSILARFGGVTPWQKSDALIQIGVPRNIEIRVWMQDCGKPGHLPKPDKFVILDDMAEMGLLHKHLVKCDSYTGLTEEIADEVIQRLNAK